MGSRQSVSQPPRPRIPPSVAANVSELHADLLSQVLSQTTRHGRSGRSNRSLSMPGPSVSPPHILNRLKLPFVLPFSDLKCPVCHKVVPSDDVECHLVMCLTRPRITYNEDLLSEDKGECVICLDDMNQGDTIARLPCLCIYHKTCIDSWFKVKNSCPEHPGDD
ncbi:zf-RING 2 domain containing protein [Trichuris trichiura]|uniref:E3 ubiquitin-protein ligase ZNRF1 n=1 Tax=Trichuris trichiura TaxID=36087 RepID=A0A077ZG93_TRITR|nr:zf-RING 2 domain containing protein [Trichuris trichiura]